MVQSTSLSKWLVEKCPIVVLYTLYVLSGTSEVCTFGMEVLVLTCYIPFKQLVLGGNSAQSELFLPSVHYELSLVPRPFVGESAW